MSSGGARKRKGGHEEHEEHVNHERWLVSYADMLTLLFVLFVVLFSMSSVDQKKFAELAAGLSQGFGASSVAMTGNVSNLEGTVQNTSVVPIDLALLSGDGPMVSDQAWEWMQPLLPSSTGRRGGRWRDHRQVVEAICWKYRTGTPWRRLPAQFGPWQTAYERLSRWRADGTWARVLSQARTDAEAARELAWLFAVDTPAVRAPDAPGDDAATAEESAAA